MSLPAVRQVSENQTGAPPTGKSSHVRRRDVGLGCALAGRTSGRPLERVFEPLSRRREAWGSDHNEVVFELDVVKDPAADQVRDAFAHDVFGADDVIDAELAEDFGVGFGGGLA
jgi:hypothetical protein